MSDTRRDTELFDALAEDYVERMRRGEAPDLDDYAREHPQLAEQIRRLFPLLSVMADVRGVSDTPEDGGRAAPSAAPHLTPTSIDGYTVVAALGQGGMGRVFRARPDEGGADVAIKVIHPHLVSDPASLARFLQEARVGARIDHPNVVKTLGAGVIEEAGSETPYLVLEHVEGQTLRALLDEVGRVPERLGRLVARRVADALVAIHARGIVHRDIKPGNVLITADETIKVMDLGVALLQEELFRLSQTGEFVGSLLYAAPEQLDGRVPDARTDLYALGLMLFEMAAGRLPARYVAEEKGPVLPNASPFFSAVVRTLLERDPEARFTSAEELRDVLRAGERGAWWRRRDRGRRTVSLWLRSARLDAGRALCGREAELQTLDTAFAQLGETEGRVVVVEGEAGVGKSRLVYEWLDRLEQSEPDARVVVVRHAPGSDVASVPPLAEALVGAFGLRRLQEWIAEALGAGSLLAQALARQLSGLPNPQDARALPAGSLSTAWLRILRQLAGDAPLVLVIEDLHYAGHDGRALFRLLARGLRSAPVLLIGTTRPRPEAGDDDVLRDLDHLVALDLTGLDTASSRALLRQAHGGTTPIAEEAALVRKADGNPFFLLELARALREGAGRSGDDADPSAPPIPSTVRHIIEARLTRLTERQRELLEAGACCGFEFDPTLVAEATGLASLRALKRFARLERTAGLLQAAGKNYAFRHHLVQEVLYDEMHPRLREAYSAAIGRVLLRRARERGGDIGGADAAALCRHLLAGALAAEAAPYVVAALAWLVPRAEYDRAIELAEQALAEPAVLGPDARVDVHRLLGQSLQSVSRYEEAREHLEAALVAADALDAYAHAVHTRLDLGILRERLADHDGALGMHREAAELAIASGDVVEEARARSGLAGVLMRHRHMVEAHEHAQASIDLLPLEGHELVELEVIHTMAQVEVRRGEGASARRHLQEAWTLARRLGNRAREHAVLSTLGHLAFVEGEAVKAHEYLERAIELVAELGKHDDLSHLRINDATCLMYLGRFEEAQEVVQRALDDALAIGHKTAVTRSRARLAEVLEARGHLADALDELLIAAPEAERVSDAAADGSCAKSTARVLAALGRPEEAEAALDAWLDRVRGKARDAMSMPASAMTIRGRALEDRGRHAEALEYYHRAYDVRASIGRKHPDEPLALGRAYALEGDADRARPFLEEAVELSRGRGAVGWEALAGVHLAALPGGNPLSAAILLERSESAIPLRDRMAARFLLWELTRDPDHLAQAHAHLMHLVEHAPQADRAALVEHVLAHRRVAEAWAAHDASAAGSHTPDR
ncbi:MAG: protein kinase [Planctomycetota bacterium]|nr:protein kinase [Planctomycetota bacterium]